MDTPSKRDLIAANKSVEEIRQFIEADSLAYLSLEGLLESCAGEEKTGYCTAVSYTHLDVYKRQMHAVAEAARKVAMTGATPVAATNCLNFGNPEKPEIMAQLSAAIDGIAEACTALSTPITGGNVSLYNETRGEGTVSYTHL